MYVCMYVCVCLWGFRVSGLGLGVDLNTREVKFMQALCSGSSFCLERAGSGGMI